MFTLSENEQKKVDAWKAAIELVYGETGTLVYKFTTTGTSCVCEIYSVLTKKTLKVTDESDLIF